MNLRSDNEASVHPQILEAIMAANEGSAPAYGADSWTVQVQDSYSDLFEREVVVFPLVSGTAANCLCIAQCTLPTSAVLCHDESHIYAYECGAPELYSGGAKLIGLPGEHGKIDCDTLTARLGALGHYGDHDPEPRVISVTQGTDLGTLYDDSHLRQLCDIAHHHGMVTHMDGARFANAVVALGCSPAEASWKAGIDMLSFGATKNGAMAAEAAVFFDPEMARGFGRRRMKAAHLLSKMRYISAQLLASIKDDLWLRTAAHANAAATLIGAAFDRHEASDLLHPVQINEVFVQMPKTVDTALRAAGFSYHPIPDGDDMYRMVAPHDCEMDEVKRMCAVVDAVQ